MGARRWFNADDWSTMVVHLGGRFLRSILQPSQAKAFPTGTTRVAYDIIYYNSHIYNRTSSVAH